MMADKKEKELLRVYDKDGQFKTLAVPCDLCCSDVLVLFGKKVVGFQASQFRLCVEYKGAKSSVIQTAFPYFIAKELEADAPNDEGRMKGVSKVKFYSIDASTAETLPKYEPVHLQRKGSETNGHAKPAAVTRKPSNSSITTTRKPSDPPARKSSESEISTPKRSSGDGSGTARKNSDSGVTPRRTSGGDGSLSARKNSTSTDGSLSARKNSTTGADGSSSARKNSIGDGSLSARKNSSGSLRKSDEVQQHPQHQQLHGAAAGTRRSVIGKSLPKLPSKIDAASSSSAAVKALPPTPSSTSNHTTTTTTTPAAEVSTPVTPATTTQAATPSTAPTTSTTSNSTTTSSSTTPTVEAKELVELSTYLLKKEPGPELSLVPVWAYFRPGQGVNGPVIAIFENHDSNDPMYTHYLNDAKYDLQLTEDCPFPFLTITLTNGTQHVFTAETIDEWYESLQQATKVWVPPPPSLAPQQPVVKRSSTHAPMPVVSMEQILMKKNTLRASIIESSPTGEFLQHDNAIIAWVNFCCSKTLLVSPATLCQDMRDGLALARCVEVLFDQQITTKIPNSVFDFNHNASVSLDSLRQCGAPTNSLSPSDIVDCKQPRVLFSLLWNLFFFFVGGSEESGVKDKLAEWSKGALPDANASKIQDGTLFAAILHKSHPEDLDFDVSLQQDQATRLSTVLAVAEKQLKVPKLHKESAFSDERVSTMYLGLLYLAIVHDDKWASFLRRVNTSGPSALDPVASPLLTRHKATTDAVRPAAAVAQQPKLKPAAGGTSTITSANANATPVVTATLRTTPRKLSSSKVAKAEQTKESTQALLANIKLKHVATKTAATKAPAQPSGPVIPQLKKAAKIAPLLVAEGFKGVSAKPEAKTAAKPATSKVGAKPGAKLAAPGKPAAKPAPGKVAAKPVAKPGAKPAAEATDSSVPTPSSEPASTPPVINAPPLLPYKPEGLTLPDLAPTTGQGAVEEATDANAEVKEVVATEHSDPAETTETTEATEAEPTESNPSHEDVAHESEHKGISSKHAEHSEPERDQPEAEQSESERTESEPTDHTENVVPEHKEPESGVPVHKEAVEPQEAVEHKEAEYKEAEYKEAEYKEERQEPVSEAQEPKETDPEHKEPELVHKEEPKGTAETVHEEPEPELKMEQVHAEPEHKEPESVPEPERNEPEKPDELESKEPEQERAPEKSEESEHAEPSTKHVEVDIVSKAPVEVPAGVAVFDPLATTLSEDKKDQVIDTVWEVTGTAVYDATTATVLDSTAEQPDATTSTTTTITATETTTTSLAQETSGVTVYDATTGTISDEKTADFQLEHPSITNSATESSEKPEADDEGDDDSDYDDSEDDDSGDDAPSLSQRNIQVNFQKNLHSRGSRIEAMKKWRQSSVALQHEDDNVPKLGPILTREEAVKEGFLDESDSTPTTTSTTSKRASDSSIKRTVGFFVSESDNNSSSDEGEIESEEEHPHKPAGEDLYKGSSNNNNDTSSGKLHDQEAKVEDDKQEDKEGDHDNEKPTEGDATETKEGETLEPTKIEQSETKTDEGTTTTTETTQDTTDTENEITEAKEAGAEGAGTNEVGEEPAKEEPLKSKRKSKPPKVVIRVTLEGFGEAQFRSFSIDPKTLAGDVVLMMAEKMKFTEIEVPEYGLFVVKNGLERLLDSDEEVMSAEVNVEKFVYKRNYENEGDRDRKLLLSIHRSKAFKYQPTKK